MSVEVLTGVLALGVQVVDEEVLVDVYGSTVNICGSVRFRVADAGRREQTVTRLQQWADAETPLTFVQRGRSITLQDDVRLYGGQLVSEA